MNPLDAKVNFPCLILSIDSNLPLLELRLGVDTFFCFHKSSSEENHGNSLLRCEDRTRDASALIRSSSSCSCRRASNLIPWIAYAWNIMKQWFSCKILLGNSVWKFILYSLILILQAAKKKNHLKAFFCRPIGFFDAFQKSCFPFQSLGTAGFEKPAVSAARP